MLHICINKQTKTDIMKVAKNNPEVKVNTNSDSWKFVIFNPNQLDKIIMKARTLEGAKKTNKHFEADGWIIDELVFPNEIDRESTLKECFNYRLVTDNAGKEYKVKKGREFLDLMIKLQRQNKL